MAGGQTNAAEPTHFLCHFGGGAALEPAGHSSHRRRGRQERTTIKGTARSRLLGLTSCPRPSLCSSSVNEGAHFSSWGRCEDSLILESLSTDMQGERSAHAGSQDGSWVLAAGSGPAQAAHSRATHQTDLR